MKVGDFLITKKTINIPTFHKITKEQLNVLKLEENEKCEIIKINLRPEYTVEVKCRNLIIGFSLIDIEIQPYEFYQHLFYDYRLSIQEIRKQKLNKLNETM